METLSPLHSLLLPHRNSLFLHLYAYMQFVDSINCPKVTSGPENVSPEILVRPAAAYIRMKHEARKPMRDSRGAATYMQFTVYAGSMYTVYRVQFTAYLSLQLCPRIAGRGRRLEFKTLSHASVHIRPTTGLFSI